VWHYSAVSNRPEPNLLASANPGLSWPARLVLLVRIWWLAATIQVVLWRRPLPRVVSMLDAPGDDPRMPIGLLNRAISRALRVGRWQPRCLLRSLVLFRMLRAQGDPAELVIGLPHDAASRDAHSWVELHGRDVGPAPGGFGYQELTRYPRNGRQTSTPGQ